MAARRAAAKAAAAVAEKEADEKKAEPEPKPEEKKEEDKPAENKSLTDDEKKKEEESKKEEGPKDKVTERVIERIIICPQGQNPYMPPPPSYPPQGYCQCQEERPSLEGKKRKLRKGRKGTLGEDGLCQHPFCIVQRAKIKPQGLPWASGMFPHQGRAQPDTPPALVCHRPVLCCCNKCNPPPSDSSDSEEDDPGREDTATYMTFMNMVFAASNVMNERPDVF